MYQSLEVIRVVRPGRVREKERGRRGARAAKRKSADSVCPRGGFCGNILRV
jgi:hypothetical protein